MDSLDTPKSARDELADVLMADELLTGTAGMSGWDYALAEADAILAAGYRKPRTITTAEELDALAHETVIRTDNGRVYEKGCFIGEEDFPFWALVGEQRPFGAPVIPLPATVLWEPTA